jgi:hypothetical protein
MSPTRFLCAILLKGLSYASHAINAGFRVYEITIGICGLRNNKYETCTCIHSKCCERLPVQCSACELKYYVQGVIVLEVKLYGIDFVSLLISSAIGFATTPSS